MSRAIFSSLDGGRAPLDALAAQLAGLALPDGGAGWDLQVMCFAFSDPALAGALGDLARRAPGLTVRLLADWSQGVAKGPSQVPRLAADAPPNLHVKYKLDLPYVRDPGSGRLVWRHAASLGMLHHKTLCLRRDRRPVWLALGSANWSLRARAAYENVLVLDTGGEPGEDAIRTAMAAEFDALWRDHRLSAAPGRVRAIVARLQAEAAAGADLAAPGRLAGILGLSGAPPDADRPRVAAGGVDLAAFSGSRPFGPGAAGGHAPENDRRRIDLLRPSGARAPAPLTLTTLALEAIRGIPAGAGLDVAMYALSPRVAEYDALLGAARRGCRLRLLLDARLGRPVAARLAAAARAEGLALDLRLSGRRMHQKYLCAAETGLVLTGTANMTTDAAERHSDHRLLLRTRPDLAGRFAADFAEIWRRLPTAA